MTRCAPSPVADCTGDGGSPSSRSTASGSVSDQTLELARIAAQVALEEGDRRGKVGRGASRVAELPVTSGEVTIVAASPTDDGIDVPIVVHTIAAEAVIDVPILTTAEPGALEPVASPTSTPPARPWPHP